MVLLQRGRVTVRDVVRYVNIHTIGRKSVGTMWEDADGSQGAGSSFGGRTSPQTIPTRLVQQSLMILIQHHCVLHSNHASDPKAVAQEEYFEVNVDETLARLRFGTYVHLANEWGGDEAEAVLDLLLYHGQMRAGDVLAVVANARGSVMESLPHDVNAPGARAIQPGNENRAAAISALLVRMLQESLLRPSTVVQHVSRQDRQIAYEDMLRKAYKGVPTAKTLKEFKVKVAAMMDEEDRREWETPMEAQNEPRLGLKRKADAAARPGDKRAKKAGGRDAAVRPTAEAASSEWEIDPEVWLRVHYDGFNVRMRDQILIRAVSQKYNTITGEVFRTMLKNDLPGPVRCEMEERSRPISLAVLAKALPKEVQIQRGLDRRSIMEEHGVKSATPSTQALLAEYLAIMSDNDSISSSVRTKRFLAPFGNATTTSAGGSVKVATSFTVEYANIVRQLQQDMVRDVVVERFGPMAGRIFSILVDKGKLEEKHEVPKSNERNPQRTFYLWFVDVAKCKAWLQDHYNKTLMQLIRRRLFEQRRKASLLRKAERSDVKEDSEDLLADWEYASLATLRSIEEGLTVVETRIVWDTFLLGHFVL